LYREINATTDPTKQHRLIRVAAICGWSAWALDTADFGADEILLGTQDEVVRDILHHHELAEFPADWTLTELAVDVDNEP
jgi:hypothetical protein